MHGLHNKLIMYSEAIELTKKSRESNCRAYEVEREESRAIETRKERETGLSRREGGNQSWSRLPKLKKEKEEEEEEEKEEEGEAERRHYYSTDLEKKDPEQKVGKA